MVRVKRVYDEPAVDDGRRVLVDRLWPRGLTKQAARADEWLRDVAPSAELRTWYHADRSQFAAFAARYRRELADAPASLAFERLTGWAEEGELTLLTSSREIGRSHADVLADLLRAR